MSSITKVLIFLLANYSIYYTAAANCGLVMRENPDSPGNAKTNNKRKDKLPVNTENLPPGCDEGDAIDIELPNGKMKTFNRQHGHLRNGSNKLFRGESEDGSSFQYIRTDNHTIFGSLVDLTDQTVSQFRIDSLGNQIVDTIPTNEFPREADPVHDERLLLESDEPVSTNSSSFIQARSPRSVQSSRSRALLDDLGGNLDIMVVWTSNAECRNSGLATGCSRSATTKANMMSLINLAVTETNTAFDLSGVQTQLNLVHARHVGAYTEVSGDAFDKALSHITSTSDGVIDHIHALRTQYGADLVAMIIDDPQYCGMAWVGPSKEHMFSVTSWSCATGYYSFGHEIGHNLGCNHDRGTKSQCASSNYNYGWRDPNARFRSILAYNCVSGQCDNNPGGGCTRVQRFSNKNIPYNGSPIGSDLHDNAKQINNVKALVAGYYPHKPTYNPAEICTNITRRRKCRRNASCKWAGGSCSLNPCSLITRRRKCRRTSGCSWSSGRCI